MLELSSVSKSYATPRGSLLVLDRVDFALASGAAAAITGPSGSGKSTLLYLVGALEPPSSGTVRIAGIDPYALGASDLADFRNRHVGFVFQDHCLLPQLSVLENVLVPTLVGRDDRGRAGDQTAVARQLIHEVGLAERLDHKPAALSGGERQRVAIARALVRQPRLVLCDEPTGNLDADTAATITALLLDLHRHRETTLVVVTHSPVLAAAMPARYELNRGRLSKVAD